MQIFRNALLLVILLCLVVTPLAAQEATPEVTATPEPDIDPPNPYFEDGTIVLDLLEIAGLIFAAFLAGGFTVGAFATRLLRNQQAMDTLERVALNTIPSSALPLIRQIILDGRRLTLLADRITDGLPNHPELDLDFDGEPDQDEQSSPAA